jgi:hypothetical protein
MGKSKDEGIPLRAWFYSLAFIVLIWTLPSLSPNCDHYQGYSQTESHETKIITVCFEAKCQTEKEKADDSYYRACNDAPFGSAVNFAINYFTPVIDDPVALFTACLFAATVMLWLVTQRILKDAGETSRKQLRAYIGIEETSTAITPSGPEADWPIFNIVFKNAGPTPAHDIIGRIDALVKKLPLAESLEFTSVVIPRPFGSVGPNGSFHMRLTWESPLNDIFKEAIANRQLAIFIFGDVQYTDIFGKDWKTEFVVVFNDMSLKDPDHQLPTWTVGNRST